MRPLMAAAIFAVGCSFVLVALKGGDHALAAGMAMAACSTTALMIRLLGPASATTPSNRADQGAARYSKKSASARAERSRSLRSTLSSSEWAVEDGSPGAVGSRGGVGGAFA